MKRDSFVIYRSLYTALQGVSDKSYKRIMNAIFKYSLDGEEVELTGTEKAVFQLTKTQIDANNKKYENGMKGGEFGHLGGRPRKKPQENPTETAQKVSKYEEVMTDFGVSDILKPVLFEFIKHCQLNGRKLTNDKLESVIIELDKQDTEAEKITLVNNAINGGYFDIRRG